VWDVIKQWWKSSALALPDAKPEQSYQLKKVYEQLGGFYPQSSEENFVLAFTHASQNGRPGHNFEQLEFLGDAVLSAIVAETLFQHFPGKREGELSKMRAWIVSRRQLNMVAQEIGLQEHIRHKIVNKRVEEARHLAGDVLEALLGAYYLDSGIAVVREIALRWILTEEILEASRKGIIDPKSTIHEWAQRKRRQVRFLQLNASSQQPDIFEIVCSIDGEIIGTGTGRNKKEAERAAAEAAVIKLGI
jgi:ribonuclease III